MTVGRPSSWGSGKEVGARTSDVLLPLVGPSVIVALLVTSVLPEVSEFGAELARHAGALLITLAVP
jgi:hypothetical protein